LVPDTFSDLFSDLTPFPTASVHRGAASRLQKAKWLHIEWLPPYAAELNPVEYLWGHTKYHELPNLVPEDKHHLDDAVNEAFVRLP